MAIQRPTDQVAPQGLSLPEVPQQQTSQPETIYYMETEDGFQVRVPESKIDDWAKAQEEYKRTGQLTKQQQLVKDALMRRLREGRFD